MSWQWGQVQHGDLSLLYGRVFPPPDAADPERMPGFVGVLGPDGPLGYATNVRIYRNQRPDRGGRTRIEIRGRGAALDLTIRFDADPRSDTRSAGSAGERR